MAKATMHDVAKEAGVSVATVSRALRTPDVVSVKTKQRVEKAAKKTHYKHSKVTLVSSGTSPVIGVIVPSPLYFSIAGLIMGIHEASQEMGFAVTVGCSNYDSLTERKLLEKFRKNRIAGLIVLGFSRSNESLIRTFIHTGVPVCVMSETATDAEISYIGFDNFKVVYDLANYLISLGHRHIGLLCGPFSKNDRAHRRLNGYRAALEEHDIVYDTKLVYEGNPSLEEGKYGMKQIMSLPEPPSAILAASDVFALGALVTARDMGLRIPEDVSIVGLDDIPYTEYSIPPITTAHVPTHEIGYKCVEVIAQNSSGQHPKVIHKCFDTPIVFRKSTQEYNGSV